MRMDIENQLNEMERRACQIVDAMEIRLHQRLDTIELEIGDMLDKMERRLCEQVGNVRQDLYNRLTASELSIATQKVTTIRKNQASSGATLPSNTDPNMEKFERSV